MSVSPLRAERRSRDEQIAGRDAAPVTTDASDGEIIAAARDSPERFAEIFDRHYAEIHRYVDRRLGADAADDIAAETFLIAFRARERFDTVRTSARPWLYGIATNLIGRHRRSETRRYRAMARMEDRDVVEGHEDRVLSAVAAGDGTLSAALGELAHGDRDVLLLVALGELSYPEVAQALDIAYGTVCSRLSRARRKVRASLPRLQPSTRGGSDA
ncbi:RNA polymerase sigma factor [Actinomadura harenae]|uniref:RNA polymerase sigma factor n=1 Tax=Actinomadura harenae TaxID=2483351 RepID=A0A3M2LVJ8_9ACTN|nr:RNA polymerase sigma factor [Actinomadura harenae]RMI41397.1 RNA polymerase sigma factor [Actinomadura harenae]